MQKTGFLIKFYNEDMTINRKMFCETYEITIGRGLFNSIRLQYPSINEIHAIINAREKKVKPLGPDVFINEKLCVEDSGNLFEFGDIIKLHKLRISISVLDDTKIERGNEILGCPKKLEYLIKNTSIGSQVEIQPNLYILKSEYKNNSNSDFLNMKSNISLDNENKIKSKNDNTQSEKNSPFSSEIVNIRNDINTEPMEKESNFTNLENKLNKKPDNKINYEQNEQFKMETNVVGNINDGEKISKKETHITTEISSNYYIEQGVIYQKVTENINVDQCEEINTPVQKETPIISTDVQTAVKLIDANSSETKVEDALDEGKLTVVKEAIVNQKGLVNEEIKDSIENIITDIPADPLQNKKTNIDLGEAVIEKDILNVAEENLQQTLEKNKKKVGSSQFSELSSKPVLETGELTNLINETSEKSTETVFIKESQPKNPFFDQTNSELTETNLKNTADIEIFDEPEKREVSISMPSPKRTKLYEDASNNLDAKKEVDNLMMLGIENNDVKKVDHNGMILNEDKIKTFNANSEKDDNKNSDENLFINKIDESKKMFEEINTLDKNDINKTEINETFVKNNENTRNENKEIPAILDEGVKKIENQEILTKKYQNEEKFNKNKIDSPNKKSNNFDDVNNQVLPSIVNQDVKKVSKNKITEKKSNDDVIKKTTGNDELKIEKDKKSKDKSKKKIKKTVGFDNLTVQVDNDKNENSNENDSKANTKKDSKILNKDVEGVKEDLKKKSNTVTEKRSKGLSNLTTTPRATRKASMINNETYNIPISNPRRSKRNAASKDESKNKKSKK